MCNGIDILLCRGRRTELDYDPPLWSSEEARYFRVLIILQVLLPVVRYCHYTHDCVTLAAVGRIIEGVLFLCLRASRCVPLQYNLACKQRSPPVWQQTL
jgi:hypothetical protein